MTRIRLASLGPPKARIDDLTIPLTDAHGRASDSVIWLRNAGGKSTILALVLALLEPDRRHFLGVRSDHRQRALEDYIGKDDQALVVAEWELDVEGQLDVAPPPRFLTGVLQERHYGRNGGEPEIRRLFFAGKILPAVPTLTIEGLPYYLQRDGRRYRRGWKSFRQVWDQLRQEHPAAELSTHESHTEWRERLESVGIDSDLFRYQVQMNEKEGGADAVFKFTSVDGFVRLFLDMLLRPTAGTEACSNLDTYREKLRRRTTYQPESTLIEGLLKRMEHVLDVAEVRAGLAQELARAAREIQGLLGHVRAQLTRVATECAEASEQAQEQHRLAQNARSKADTHYRGAARAEHWRVTRQIAEAGKRVEEARTNLKRAEHDEQVWEAAEKLAEAGRHEAEAAAYRRQIEERLEEHRPLKERVLAAAARYGAALVSVLEHLEWDLEQRDIALQSLEEAIRAQRAEEVAQQRAGAAARARAEREEQDRNKAVEAHLRLEADGFIEPMQTVEVALAAVNERRSALQEEAAQADVRLSEIDEKVEHIGDDQVRLGREQTRASAERKRLKEELERAEDEKVRLEVNPLLVRYLGVAEPDLERLTEAAPGQLDDQAARLEGEAVGLHVEQAMDARAVRYLEDVDLLPPSLDVEAVLRALHDTVQAWSGWQYMARSLPDVDARRALVRRRPEVATGIIVRDDDLDRAREVLAAARPEVEEAVTVSGASAVLGGPEPEKLVVGPAHDARIDQAAGRQERARRVAVTEERAAKVERVGEERRALGNLAQKLRGFQERYGANWFTGRRSEIRDLEEREASIGRQIGALGERERALRAEKATLMEQRKRRAAEIERIGHARSRLRAFQEQHPGGIEGYEAAAGSARREAEVAGRLAAAAAGQVEDLSAEQLGLRAARWAVAARRSDHDRALNALELTERPEAEPGALNALQSAYTSRLREYQGKVEDTGLKSQVEAAERNGRIYRQHFEEACAKRALDPEEVGEALDALANPSLIEARREKARADAAAAWGTIGRQHQLRAGAEERLKTNETRCRELGISGPYDDPQEAPGSLEEANLQIAELTAAAEEQEAQGAEYGATAEMFDREAAALVVRETVLKKVEERLETLQDAHASLLSLAVSTDGWAAPTSDAELERRSKQLREELSRHEETDRSLSDRGERAFRDVHGWLVDERFRSLKSTLLQSLGRHSAGTLEKDAYEIRDQLEQRLEFIRYEIEHINRDRDDVVAAVTKEAEEALQMLASLERHSRLPEDLPCESLRGQHVLRVTTGIPKDPGARKARVGDYLDSLIREEKSVSAAELVKEAALRLGHTIQVSILAPDPARRERRPITELAIMSGGERMTCATMLYCALARLRARNRGAWGLGSSVLLLDNPVGTASWRSLIELQRSMARSMSIQLVYLTGVQDYEAISAMTNVVRLRNGRLDVRTGERIVEFAGQIEGPAQLQRTAASTSGVEDVAA